MSKNIWQNILYSPEIVPLVLYEIYTQAALNKFRLQLQVKIGLSLAGIYIGTIFSRTEKDYSIIIVCAKFR
jgi:hypothetical protein